MSSRIQSDLLLVDGALRSCPSRTLLKGGSADAWDACCASLLAVLPILQESVLADQGGSVAAISMHWRKSSAGKKLLALLRAVVEEAHALQGEAAHAAKSATCHTVHGSIDVIRFFWQRTRKSATLWPAMREWIVELGGITSLWTALAWAVMIPMQDCEAAADVNHQNLLRATIHTVLELTLDMFSSRRPVELAQNSAVLTVMSCVLGTMLPRDFKAGDSHAWDLRAVFHAITALHPLEGSVLSVQLHKPMLVFWPYLIAEVGRQRRLLSESEGTTLFNLKVYFHTVHTIGQSL